LPQTAAGEEELEEDEEIDEIDEDEEDEEYEEDEEDTAIHKPEEQTSPRGHTFVPSQGTQRPFTHTCPLVQRLPVHCADELDELDDDEDDGLLEEELLEEGVLTEEELEEVLLDELVLDVETHVPLPLH
jgi:hypothetical protein